MAVTKIILNAIFTRKNNFWKVFFIKMGKSFLFFVFCFSKSRKADIRDAEAKSGRYLLTFFMQIDSQTKFEAFSNIIGENV